MMDLLRKLDRNWFLNIALWSGFWLATRSTWVLLLGIAYLGVCAIRQNH
jgi:hypothetical protein